MFFPLGRPVPLSSLDQRDINNSEAKSRVRIAVLDDNSFAPKEALASHQFKIDELGPDIRSLDQISSYPIIVCDVAGVGRAFGSDQEGAYIVSEIRKEYPDKFLIGYTGETHSIQKTNALSKADIRMEKDAPVEAWVKNLEIGVREVMHPGNRWKRMRRALLERGVEIFDVLLLEQSFIKSVKNNNPDYFKRKVELIGLEGEAKDVVVKFASNVFVGLVLAALGG